jgi:hypothetical protein
MSMSKVRSLKLVRGSGNVFRDFGQPDAELSAAKRSLRGRIVRDSASCGKPSAGRDGRFPKPKWVATIL